ncbi:MAG: GNAT family N-acetyltransferase [Rhodobacteraceae bacterium]|nr:GNAT family N-acetyltransferase [Paracoccaceae bacterium]
MTPRPPLLRKALPADAPALATLHDTVWHETYAALAPPEAARRLDRAHRLRGWQTALADPVRSAWLAEGPGGALGLVALGPADAARTAGLPAPVAEIKHLYVAAEARRTGLGRALLGTALDAAAAAGAETAVLGVVRQNYAARLFYADCGGREVGDFTDPGPLWRSLMVLVAWDLTARR